MSTAQPASAPHTDYSSWAETIERPRSCLYCGHARVWWNGWWTRTATVWQPDGAVWVKPFPVRRVKCAACLKSWGLRPPGVFPHRHFQLDTIAEAEQRWLFEPEASLSTAAARVGCSPRSVARWARWLAGLVEPGALLARLADVAGVPLVPRLRDVADLARKATSEAARQVLRRAAQVLGLLEILGAAAGLEPTGLRGVLLHLVGDRAHQTTDASPLLPEVAARAPGLFPASLPM